MSQISITGASTGTATFTIESPATSTNRTLTLPDNTGTIITQNSTPAFASTIGVGGATAAASGAGITFPATQSASSDANTLDDYEEGTWTPSLGGTTTYNSRSGTYTKIGRLVYVYCAVNVNLIGTGSTNTISGLPFSASQRGGGGMSFFSSLSKTIDFLAPYSNSTNVSFIGTITQTGNVTDAIAIFQNGAHVVFALSYEV
jgi:hypothetical protein